MGAGPVAVIVLSHRNPAQVARLVNRITSGRNAVAIVHHDPSGEPLSLPPSDRVLLVPDPRPCQWGRLSLVEAQWRSLKFARAAVPEMSWALLVSGQDYPIAPMAEIEAELDASPHDGYLRHFLVTDDPADDVDPWQTVTRRRYLYKRRLPGSHRAVPLPVRRRDPFRDGNRLFVGDMWFNLSARAVDRMLNDPFADRLMRFLAPAPVPDETFVCSLALNSSPGLDVVNDSKRFIKWSAGAAHPDMITASHLDELRASDAFFARKFDAAESPEVFDLIDGCAAERATRRQS